MATVMYFWNKFWQWQLNNFAFHSGNIVYQYFPPTGTMSVALKHEQLDFGSELNMTAISGGKHDFPN